MGALYKIDNEILAMLENGFTLNCCDLETGEIDEQKAAEYLEQLHIERNAKIENIALYIKNLDADAEKIKEEEKNLKARRESKEKKAERLREYLKSSMLTFGEPKFETARVALSFRTSKSVVIDDMEKLDKKYIQEKVSYTADKTAIKKAIASGEVIEGARLEENYNLQVR
jgi:seryl-tRNA synthetase